MLLRHMNHRFDPDIPAKCEKDIKANCVSEATDADNPLSKNRMSGQVVECLIRHRATLFPKCARLMMKKIAERNAKKQEKHGVTKFADLTTAEFLSKFTGNRPTTEKLKKRMQVVDHRVPANYSSTAVSIDWNAKGALTSAKSWTLGSGSTPLKVEAKSGQTIASVKTG